MGYTKLIISANISGAVWIYFNSEEVHIWSYIIPSPEGGKNQNQMPSPPFNSKPSEEEGGMGFFIIFLAM